MRKTALLLLVALLSALSQLPFFVKVAYAESEINLMDIPELLGEKLGINAFAGGLLASIILLAIVVLPCAMLIRGKHAGIVTILFGMCILGFSVAVGWFPVWLFGILILILALGYAKTFSEMIAGGK